MTAPGQVQYKGRVDSNGAEVGSLCYELATLAHPQPSNRVEAWPNQPAAATPSPWRTEASPSPGNPQSPSPPCPGMVHTCPLPPQTCECQHEEEFCVDNHANYCATLKCVILMSCILTAGGHSSQAYTLQFV